MDFSKTLPCETEKNEGDWGFIHVQSPVSQCVLQVLLESGSLVTFTVARHSGDIETMLIDRSLIPRLDGPLDKGSE